MNKKVKLLQSNVVNVLMQFDTNHYEPMEVIRRGVFEREYYVGDEKNNLVIRLEHPTDYDGKLKLEDFNFSATTHRLLVYIRELFTYQGKELLDFSIKEYMNRCNLKDRKYARRQLERDLYALSAVRFFTACDDSYILESFSMHHGRVYIELYYKFAAEIRSYSNYILLPLDYYKINIQRFHVAPALLYFMLIYNCMNKPKSNHSRLSISSLLAHGQFPTIEAVRQTSDNSIKARIFEPFFQNMAALKGMVIFKYFDTYNEEVTEEDVRKLQYDDLVRIVVEFKFK